MFSASRSACGVGCRVACRLVWFTVFGLVAVTWGCSRSSKDGGSAGDLGSVKMALQPLPGIVFSAASYALTGPQSFSRGDTVDLSHSGTLSFVIGAVPAGQGYVVAVNATSVDGGTACTGTSPAFGVGAGQTILVSLKLDCHQGPRTGSVVINGTLNVCPVLDGIEANPAEVLVGSSAQLSASAHDADQGPAPLAYAWTAGSGAFGVPSAASTSFTCTQPGAVQVTVAATDGDTTPGCADSATVTITCTPPTGGAGGAGGGTGNMAVLRPNVKVLDPSQISFISQSPETWVVQGTLEVNAGDVLLLDTVAVKVLSAGVASGQTTLSVEGAELEEVFSRLSISQDIDLARAQVLPDSGAAGASGSALQAPRSRGVAGDVAAKTSALTVTTTAGDAITFAVDLSPFTGSVTFGINGTLTAGYDDTNGVSGMASVTGDVNATATVALSGTGSVATPEVNVKTLYFPVPYSIFDSTLRLLGIRLASVQIPITVGAEATAGYGVSLTVSGDAGVTYGMGYTGATGFMTTGPTLFGSAGITAGLPGVGPDAVFRGTLEAGVFVRAKPQLLILNEVASVGVNVKTGLYADGMLSAFLDPPPYFCIEGQPNLKCSAFAFFKAVRIPEKDSSTITGMLDIGPPYTVGACDSDGGTDAGGAGGGTGSDGGSDAAPGPPDPPPIGGSANGDPHLLTFDGVRYDNQAWGEETLSVADTGDLEVQARTHQLGSTNVAVIVATAARVGTDRIAFHLNGDVSLNGSPTVLPSGLTTLPAGGHVWNTGGGYVVVWPDNSQLRLSLNGFYMGVKVYVPPTRIGHLSGLLGNANGDPSDDLQTRDGKTVLTSPASFDLFYKTFANSWRITDARSDFDYPPGENTESPDITNPNFPTQLQTAASLDSGVAQSSAAVCVAAGVPGDWMDACTLDVALSGSPQAAGAFVGAPPALASFEVQQACLNCGAGNVCCDGVCTSTALDSANCGGCGRACPVAGATCSNGACGCAAPKSATCGQGPSNAAACVDLTSDSANCGKCGTICAGATPVCSNGSCVASCNTASGQTLCGAQCVTLGSDTSNCGACGRTCATSEVCSGGVCTALSSVGAIGCADGTREVFTNQTTFPAIAACAGGWDGNGAMANYRGVFPEPLRTTKATCAQNGNSGPNPKGTGCSATDLCAPGWHICAGGEVLARVRAALTSSSQTDACVAATWPASSFFAIAVGSTGCFECAEPSGTLVGPSCSNSSCAVGCQSNPGMTNDIFGCGTEGVAISTCGDVDRSSNNLCGSLDGGWSCGGDSVRESVNVVHNPSPSGGASGGGVICCMTQ